MTTILVLKHNTDEWARLAQDAYNTDRNDFGHKFSMAAAIYGPSMDGTLKAMRTDVFDTLQTIYRRWLVFGWSEVENPR